MVQTDMSAGLSRSLGRKLGATASLAARRRDDAQIPLGTALLGLLALALITSGVVAWLIVSADDGENADISLAQLVMNHANAPYAGDEDGTQPSRGFPSVVPGAAENLGTSPAPSGAAVGPGSRLMDANASLAPILRQERPATPSPDVLSGLRISSQSWRRGGLGSKALVTFTLRNTNGFAVKDVEINCAFARRDGGHVSDRRRVVSGEVRSQSRRTFAAVHVGFVNVNVSTAKCVLVAATKI
ncbi:conserved hypothetical protein [Bradyrhizobium sp. ORS 375]|uniref:hypothetical protein n=1 Tax=Bradyrhizobium sp. (strain ORS 375) TaxID=566679 RepID=UPI0002407A23|nr:hypothetical protein [Bradyrhizobium sp. ORS 375]CCD92584.1 conserved hypothetical protein [Bradyrhizobium sp. ORS 375]